MKNMYVLAALFLSVSSLYAMDDAQLPTFERIAAAIHGNDDKAAYDLIKGIQANSELVRQTDADGNTLLGLAVNANKTPLAALLVQKGADASHFHALAMTSEDLEEAFMQTDDYIARYERTLPTGGATATASTPWQPTQPQPKKTTGGKKDQLRKPTGPLPETPQDKKQKQFRKPLPNKPTSSIKKSSWLSKTRVALLLGSSGLAYFAWIKYNQKKNAPAKAV